jgi:glutathione S-transferase
LRVIGVIDLGLRRNPAAGNWLVGDKFTYADLCFATWASVGYGLLKELGKNEGLEKDYPNYSEWITKMEEQESVKKIRELMNRGRIAHGLKV